MYYGSSESASRRLEGRGHFKIWGAVPAAGQGWRQVGKIEFCGKWSKPGSEGVVGIRGVTSSPTTPVFLGLLPFAQKLVRKSCRSANTPAGCRLLFAGLFGKRVKIMGSAPRPPLGAAHLGSYELRIWGITSKTDRNNDLFLLLEQSPLQILVFGYVSYFRNQLLIHTFL